MTKTFTNTFITYPILDQGYPFTIDPTFNDTDADNNDINYYVGGYFHGHVVDMLYFPVIQGHYWSWIPKLGGQNFTFFSPVFNLADAFISTGAIAIFVFQGVFFSKLKKEEIIPEGDDLPNGFIDDGTADIVQE